MQQISCLDKNISFKYHIRLHDKWFINVPLVYMVITFKAVYVVITFKAICIGKPALL